MNPLIWSGLDFTAFAQQRHALLAHGGFVDAGETGLYRVLPAHDPERFAALAPSAHPKAPYRCHLAEGFLDYLGLPRENYKPRTLVSQGVRYSLSLIFRQLASVPDRLRLWLPSDVYPVYGQLAQETGVDFDTYAARAGIPWERLEHHFGWCLLVCDPLKPWGTRLSAPDWDRIVDLARATDSLVLIDGAYDLALSPALRAHLDAEAPIAFLGSLSKGWLAPLRGGVVVANTATTHAWRPFFQQASKNEVMTREAYAALTDVLDRPAEVAVVVNDARSRLLTKMRQMGVVVKDPGHGYFVVSDLSPETWWTKGVLAIPPSVFGSAGSGSVLSALAM